MIDDPDGEFRPASRHGWHERRRHGCRDRDVAILGGGLAGLCLAIQLKQRDPSLAVAVLEHRAGDAPEGAFRRLIDGGNRRALLRRNPRPARPPRTRTGTQVRLPLLLLRRQRGSGALHRTGRERTAADAVVATRPRPLREFPGRTCARARRRCPSRRHGARAATGRRRCIASRRVRAGWPRTRKYAARAGWSTLPAAPACSSTGSGSNATTTTTSAPLGGGSRASSIRTHGRTTRTGSRAARARALAFDQPPVRPGLLGVDDPARLGRAFHRHRRRRGAASAGKLQPPRQGDGMAARTPAAAGGAARRSAPRGHGLPLPAPLLARLRAVVLRRPWAITGEAGVFRSFYSPGSDFIAITNTLACELIERDRAGNLSRRTRPSPATAGFDLRQHDDDVVPGPVSAVRRRAGDAGQGDLGLHLLLVAAGAVGHVRADRRRGDAGPAEARNSCARR